MKNYRHILFEKYNIDITYKEFLLSKFQECKEIYAVSPLYIFYVDKNEKVLFCAEKEGNCIMIEKYVYGKFMLNYWQRDKIICDLFLDTFGYEFYNSRMREDFQNEYNIYLKKKK